MKHTPKNIILSKLHICEKQERIILNLSDIANLLQFI